MWKTNNSINDSKQRRRRLALSCSKKKLSTLSKHQNIMVGFIVWIAFILWEQKINLNFKYVKVKISIELQCYQKKVNILEFN